MSYLNDDQHQICFFWRRELSESGYWMLNLTVWRLEKSSIAKEMENEDFAKILEKEENRTIFRRSWYKDLVEVLIRWQEYTPTSYRDYKIDPRSAGYCEHRFDSIGSAYASMKKAEKIVQAILDAGTPKSEEDEERQKEEDLFAGNRFFDDPAKVDAALKKFGIEIRPLKTSGRPIRDLYEINEKPRFRFKNEGIIRIFGRESSH